jgi:DNA polymerase-3 subunit alpha
LMEKFAGYGFNKSHSVAYALISYQTAYLKSHYPEEYMAAVLSSDMDKTDKVVNFLFETKRMGIEVIPPDINEGEFEFYVSPDKKIHYGLGAIKGAGKAAIEIILECRQQQGKFKSFQDFFKRIDSRKVNKRILEAFIKSGAFDGFQVTRSTMMLNLEDYLHHGQKKGVQQQSLFGEEECQFDELKSGEEWPIAQKLQAEKEVLGFYLSGHPLNSYHHEFKELLSDKLILGSVNQIKTMQTRRGGRMAFVKLECLENKIMEVVLFSDIYESQKSLLVKDTLLILEGEVTSDEFTGGEKILAKNIYTLDGFREKFVRGILLNWGELHSTERSDELCQLLNSYKNGKTPVFIEMVKDKVQTRFSLGDEWRVKICEDLIAALKSQFGESQIKILYG